MSKKADGKIELRQVETGVTESFEHSHAERILDYDVKIARKNWELTDSKLKFENGKINTGSGASAD